MTLSWRSKLPPLRTAHTRMRFCLNLFNNISENSKQQINSKNVSLSIFVIFYIFGQVSHISSDWFHNHNGKQKSDLRKSNQLCTLFFSGRALFSFLAPKGFEMDNDFERFNYLFALKLFLSNINSFWCSYVNGWFESVIKDNLPPRLNWRRDAWRDVDIFLYILFSLVLILLIVVLFIPSGSKNIKLSYRLRPVILPLRNVKDRTLKKLQSLNSGDRKDGSQQMKAEMCYCLTTKE